MAYDIFCVKMSLSVGACCFAFSYCGCSQKQADTDNSDPSSDNQTDTPSDSEPDSGINADDTETETSEDSDSDTLRYQQIDVGEGFVCGVTDSLNLHCWGDNTDIMSEVMPSEKISAVSAGFHHVCALRTDGEVVCLGDNLFGQCDAPSGSYIAVAAGGRHSCALRASGEAVCWGDNQYQQAEPPDTRFSQVEAHEDCNCGLTEDGRMECWGNDAFDHCIARDGTFSDISIGSYRSDENRDIESNDDYQYICAVGDDGNVCYGNGMIWADGDMPPDGCSAVAAGGLVIYWITADGKMIFSGNTYELESDVTDRISAQENMGGFLDAASGYGHTCAIATNHTYLCWDDAYVLAGPPPGF